MTGPRRPPTAIDFSALCIGLAIGLAAVASGRPAAAETPERPVQDYGGPRKGTSPGKLLLWVPRGHLLRRALRPMPPAAPQRILLRNLSLGGAAPASTSTPVYLALS